MFHEQELYILGRSTDKRAIAFIKPDGSDWQNWEVLGSIEGADVVYAPVFGTGHLTINIGVSTYSS